MLSLLWLLLPVAAASGWYVAVRSQSKSAATTNTSLSPEYYQGLNYLIDEQPDKAIKVFCQIVEANNEKALDLHLALGNLFRRRGEVDRAINLHQNLLTNSNTTSDIKTVATIELAHDYLKAGLLDRAENLLLSLLESNQQNDTVLELLRIIYQQEKEWEKAIDVVLKFARLEAYQRRMVAHYLCEIALQDHADKRHSDALKRLEDALAYDPSCVRANIIKGKVHSSIDQLEPAYTAYENVTKQNPLFLGEVAVDLLDVGLRVEKTLELMHYFRQHIKKCPDGRSVEVFLVLLKEVNSEEQAHIFLINTIKQSASLPILYKLLMSYAKDAKGEQKDTYRLASDTLAEALRCKPTYSCEHCGFSGRMLHWLCPSCKTWGSTIPLVCDSNLEK